MGQCVVVIQQKRAIRLVKKVENDDFGVSIECLAGSKLVWVKTFFFVFLLTKSAKSLETWADITERALVHELITITD